MIDSRLLALSLSVAAASCGRSKTNCEKYADMELRCNLRGGSDVLDECQLTASTDREDREDAVYYQGRVDCAVKHHAQDDCDAYRACMHALPE